MRRIYIDIFSLKYIPPEGKKLRARVIIFTTNTLHPLPSVLLIFGIIIE